MKKYLILLLICSFATPLFAQRLLSWTPEFPLDNSNLTVTVDCNKGNQGLLNFESGNSANIYVHIGVITNLSTSATDWRYTKFTWGTADPLAHATPLGNNKYSYTINNPRVFFGVPASETIKKITCIFRNASGSLKQVNSDVSDMYIPVYATSQYAVRLNLPPSEPRYTPWLEPINTANPVTVAGVSSASSNLSLDLNGTVLNTAIGTTTISGTATISASCAQEIRIAGINGTQTSGDTARFFVAPTTVTAALPAGAQEGINYAANNTSITLVLYAPNKNNVVVIGDFSNWAVQCSNQMNRTPDGNYYWITLNGLTSGTEYGYQYLIDNNIRTADPYSQKILDPNNDQYIDAVTYPNLKPYPTGLTTDIVSVFQTAEPQYNWQATNFSRPDKKNLVIYELLIRDFTAQHSYQSLIDSFSYFKNIGINAIELMPINEFTGNESWGYNPNFYFAPDKYYGTKTKLKEFIDKCHLNGIAVLLDVVYNQCDNNAPQAKMYWDAANNRPAANNPWLNISAPHPYSVFNDFNHTSAATQYLVQRSLNFWLDEYKVDGFRLDLAKGFTQTVTNTSTVENYDGTRVTNLNRYYDGTINTHPGTYMILEFLGTLPCQEEQEYAAHGFMLWGNNNAVYNQCTMGYASNSDISPIVYSSTQKAYNNPAEVGYMESHDEERTMYKNLTYGNISGSYNVKTLATSLAREEAAASVFFTVPGPKMIWQFEERGYDIPLNFGGSNLANKPPHWEYMTDVNRRHLYDSYNKIIQLRLSNPAVFNNTSFTYDFNNSGGLYKTFQIADPASSGKKITIVANLDVVPQSKTIIFQSAGDWTNYISNGTGIGINGATNSNFTLAATSQTITLQPGEYHIYISVQACTTAAPVVTSPVTYCQNATATTLSATGTNLLWYTTATGGIGAATAPTPITTTAGSTTYYVSQTTTCESSRTSVVVNITATPAAPVITTPVNYCQNATATPLIATGTNLLWYATSTVGTGSATAPIPSTTSIGSTIFYVSQTTATCESPKASITVNITATTAAPIVITPLNYCQNSTPATLLANGTNLLWYSASTGGTGSSTAPTPVTTTAGSIIYYVSQTQTCGESPRAAITVNVSALPAAPTVITPVTYCQNAASTTLTATGTNLLWYSTATGGTGSATAPTPITTNAGSTIFYVSQTSGSCESPRASLTVNITESPSAPTVSSPVSYCLNTTATSLSATGTNLLWYSTPTGGTSSATAPTPITTTVGTAIYYASQTPGTCESPRAVITVNIITVPEPPLITSPVTYCLRTTATALTATGNNLLWYTTASVGVGTASSPIPATVNAGTTTYYVTQSNNCGESNKAAITVNVNAAASAAGLTATSITTTASTLSWTTNPGLFYTVEYKPASSTIWILLAVNTTVSNISINNLSLGTVYDWRVSSNCIAASNANYISSQFTTLSRNINMTNMRNGFGIKISPNPVSSAAIVDYIVPGNGEVSLTLLSANGQVLQQLFYTQQSAGQYQFNINGQFNNLASGIYFIRLQQNGNGNFTSFIKN